jgi:hypothetical protein
MQILFQIPPPKAKRKKVVSKRSPEEDRKRDREKRTTETDRQTDRQTDGRTDGQTETRKINQENRSRTTNNQG